MAQVKSPEPQADDMLCQKIESSSSIASFLRLDQPTAVGTLNEDE